MAKLQEQEAEPELVYIRDAFRQLDTLYDAEALLLIGYAGLFDINDGSALMDAFCRLRSTVAGTDMDAESEAMVETERLAVDGATREERNSAMVRYEELQMKREQELLDTAYFLGIAVGRRLGGTSLAAGATLAAAQRREKARRKAATSRRG